ncbi:MAG: hypothetical protein WD875_00175 [Pirellulales bacterium]
MRHQYPLELWTGQRSSVETNRTDDRKSAETALARGEHRASDSRVGISDFLWTDVD